MRFTAITANGRALAAKLSPAIGTTREILETCSLIARHAKTYHGLQELICNGGTYSEELRNVPDELREQRLEWAAKREEQLERRLTALAESLPHADGGPWSAVFGGDPRGSTVWLAAPGEEQLYDDWGRRGVCAIV